MNKDKLILVLFYISYFALIEEILWKTDWWRNADTSHVIEYIHEGQETDYYSAICIAYKVARTISINIILRNIMS